MYRTLRSKPAFSFWLKLVASLCLVALADQCFVEDGAGATVGLFALSWLAVTVLLQPSVWRDRRALAAVAAAALSGLNLIDHLTITGWALFWVAITITALSSRLAGQEDAWSWTRQLAAHSLLSVVGPIRDFQRVRLLQRSDLISWRSILAIAGLPLLGGALFVGLFASANPIIAGLFSAIQFPEFTVMTVIRAIFWLGMFAATWATLRPFAIPRRVLVQSTRPRRAPSKEQPGFTMVSAVLALTVFNLLFFVENGLDVAFLWSRASLPAGVTLAQYAHRGAYPLIATALLAGGFSLFFLRDGSATAARPLVRRLVGLWVAQNVLLSASSILRTVDYVQAYSLTRFRIAALLWMGLVTVGLVLIGWSILRKKSRVWLINSNTLALGVVLAAVSIGDLGAIAASWNVRNAREVGGAGANLDVCYLQELGSSALLPMLDLEQRHLPPELRARLVGVHANTLATLRSQQANWRQWTWRGARRLQSADMLLQRQPQLNLSPPGQFWCGQALVGPSKPSNPLTARVQP